jgi:tetratricopeptide (TPR) repeat protein
VRDLFVSYTAADRAWAEWVAWELEEAGYSTLLQDWDMPPGTAFVHAMDQAIQHTRHILLVLSPAYLGSKMTEAEWRPGFVADPSGNQRRLLPVRIERCEPKGLLADRVWIDLVGLDEATARATLLDGVARALRDRARPTSRPRFPKTAAGAAVTKPLFPTALPPVWNLPFHRNRLFTGRDGELADLAAAREEGETVAVTQVLQGGGGVGKTALATEYAYRNRSAFDTVWWVRAEEPASLVTDYAGLADGHRLPEASQPDQQVVALAVRRWLQEHDRWLLVLDNATAPDSPTGLQAPLATLLALLPHVVHGQVLITTRDASWEHHASLYELEVFTSEEAVAFLLARSGSSDQNAAAAVGELLGSLPLALEQAGAYVRETRMSLSSYLEQLRQYPRLTMTKGRPRDRDPTDTVATTWQVSLEQIRPVSGAAVLMEVCAFLGPEEIPRNLLTQPLDPPDQELAMFAEDPFTLDEAVGAVRRFGLVKASEQALTIHRLVQQVIRDQLDPITRAARAAIAVRLIAAALPGGAYLDPGLWSGCARLLPHSLAVTQHAEKLEIELLATAYLLTSTADYLHGRARFAEARALHERALAIREARLGPDHPDTAQSHVGLGIVLAEQGKLDSSRAHLERALGIFETRLGVEHPNIVTGLSNLAGVLYAQGDLNGARALIERALAIREARLGPDHPDTAQILNNLGEVLRAQGDQSAARPLFERALAIFEARLGPDHPRTAQSLDSLAEYLLQQGDLNGARALIERALAIFEVRLGSDHPDTARSVGVLAEVLRAQGDLNGARPLFERALAIREARLGPDHPDTTSSREALAAIIVELDSR